MELLSSLGINWQLLISQIVNFGLLMIVLLFFVYRPILRLIDSRRETIRKSLEDAKEIEKNKRELEQFSIEQMKKIDQESSALFATVKKQAEAAKAEILTRAQEEADAMLEKSRKTMEADKSRMFDEARNALIDVSVQLAGKILEREFTPADQKRLAQSLSKDVPALLK